MSDAQAKAERSHYKDVRQGIVEAKPVHVKLHKKERPYRIVGVVGWIEGTIGRYATLKDAEKALAVNEKKGFYKDLKIEGPTHEVQ